MEVYKLQIYQGMIQYLLKSTHYTLKDIATLSHSSITNIKSIYYHNVIPKDFLSESSLINLYQIVVNLKTRQTA